MPYTRRDCRVCQTTFTPPHRATPLSEGDNHLFLCPSCRRSVKSALAKEPAALEVPTTPYHAPAPLRQVVFDLETWGLDRGWGVTMVASFLFHGMDEPSHVETMTLRETTAWKQGRRSQDNELAVQIFAALQQCHIAYAHNGEFFDVRWLRTVALRYGLEMPRLKLIDPAAIARKKYLLGRNSLEALGDFLEIPHQKIHLSPDVWRGALLDDSEEAWGRLVERCESDVQMLNAIAGRVVGDVGMIDYAGSAFR